MIAPPFPADELLRLESLRKLEILDTNPEERFDRITRLAKKLFNSPIALVSLIDSDRQWFKSRQGLDATETPRDISFCGHAILDDKILVINDARDDERFADNPLVCSDPNIRFYAGYPLKDPDGHKVGTLCVIDTEPRDVASDDLDTLRQLGELVEEELILAAMVRDDPVTGLPNRTGFALVAEHLLAVATRTRSPATLAIFHLTNLFVIEGSLGSNASDRASIEFTQLLMSTMRNSDFPARLEQDTFAVLMIGSSSEQAESLRKRIMQRIDERNLNQASNYEIEIDMHMLDYDSDQHRDLGTLVSEAEHLMTGSAECEVIDFSAAS